MIGRPLSALLRDADQSRLLQGFLLYQCESLDDRFRREEVITAIALAASASGIIAEALFMFTNYRAAEQPSLQALGSDALLLGLAAALVVVGLGYLFLRLRQLRLEMSLVRLHFVHASLLDKGEISQAGGDAASDSPKSRRSRATKLDEDE